MFDPVEHAKKRQRYLETLLGVVEKNERENPDDISTIMGLSDTEAAKCLGLPLNVVSRITSELSDECLTEWMGSGERGPAYSLTLLGRKAAENGRYEKTPLAKRRQVVEWLKKKGAELAAIGAGKLLGWLGGWLLVLFGIMKAEAIARAIRFLISR